MKRLTKTYEDGSHGVTDDLPCGENSHAFKALLIDTLGKHEDMQEKVENRIAEIKDSADYPHNFKGQIVEDLVWVLSLLN